jgi:hypothetical protein
LGLELATTVLVTGIVAGCASKKKDDTTQKPPSAFTVRSPGGNTNIIITPASSLVGRIASVNAQANIVVVSFPVGQMPENGAKFSLFRAGAKVGEVKISGPAAETFTVGDIVAGSAREGDEVRAE